MPRLAGLAETGAGVCLDSVKRPWCIVHLVGNDLGAPREIPNDDGFDHVVDIVVISVEA